MKRILLAVFIFAVAFGLAQKSQAQEEIMPENAAQIVPMAIDHVPPYTVGMTYGDLQFNFDDGKLYAEDSQQNITELEGTDFITFSSQGILGTANEANRQLFFWDTVNPTTQRLVAGLPPMVFSPDGRLVAYVGEQNTAVIASVQTIMEEGAQPIIATLNSHFAPVRDVAFSSDGQKVITASADGTISLWNLAGDEVTILQGHTAGVNSIDIQESFLASGSDDHTVRIWDINTGDNLAVLDAGEAVNLIIFYDAQSIFSNGTRWITWGLGEAIDLPELPAEPLPPPMENMPTEGIPGTARTSLTAGTHPMHAVDCPIAEKARLLAVGRSAAGAVLLYTARCEGAVWLVAADQVDWEGELSTLPLVPVQAATPLTRLNDYPDLCENATSGGDFTGTAALYPPAFLPATAQATGHVDVVICHDYIPVTIENCHYLGPGNYSYIFIRKRTDDRISLVNVQTGQIFAERIFRGEVPPFCPRETERGEVLGAPPPGWKWVPWVMSMTGHPADPTKTIVSTVNINAFAQPDNTSEVIAQLESGTPLNLLARDDRGIWGLALLPDLSRAWVKLEHIETPVDVMQLPIEGITE